MWERGTTSKELGEIRERGLEKYRAWAGEGYHKGRKQGKCVYIDRSENFNRKETYLNRRSEQNVGRVISDQTNS